MCLNKEWFFLSTIVLSAQRLIQILMIYLFWVCYIKSARIECCCVPHILICGVKKYGVNSSETCNLPVVRSINGKHTLPTGTAHQLLVIDVNPVSAIFIRVRASNEFLDVQHDCEIRTIDRLEGISTTKK